MTGQNAIVLDWFTRRKTITPLEAIKDLGVLRLGARIFELREAGHDIHTEMMPVPNRQGGTSRVARYHYLGKAA